MMIPPEFKNKKELDFWMNGKPTRRDLMEVENKLTSLENQLKSTNLLLNKVFYMTRISGMQNETLVRMKEAVQTGFRDLYDGELKKSLLFVGFLDTINKGGEHGDKTMKEKVELVRKWNETEDTVKVEGFQFGLDEFISDVRSNKITSEYTDEELKAMIDEFKIQLPEVEATPQEVSDDKS